MHRKKKLSKILRQFNIKLIEEETLAIEGDEFSFPKMNFYLLSAIMWINCMSLIE